MIAELAVRTSIAPSILLEQDDVMLRTMVDVIVAEGEAARRG